jgi:hypothetical protein
MDSDGNSKDDVKLLEDDVGKGLQAGFDDGKDLMVTIVSAMGESRFWSWSNVVCSFIPGPCPLPCRRDAMGMPPVPPLAIVWTIADSQARSRPSPSRRPLLTRCCRSADKNISVEPVLDSETENSHFTVLIYFLSTNHHD